MWYENYLNEEERIFPFIDIGGKGERAITRKILKVYFINGERNV